MSRIKTHKAEFWQDYVSLDDVSFLDRSRSLESRRRIRPEWQTVYKFDEGHDAQDFLHFVVADDEIASLRFRIGKKKTTIKTSYIGHSARLPQVSQHVFPLPSSFDNLIGRQRLTAFAVHGPPTIVVSNSVHRDRPSSV